MTQCPSGATATQDDHQQREGRNRIQEQERDGRSRARGGKASSCSVKQLGKQQLLREGRNWLQEHEREGRASNSDGWFAPLAQFLPDPTNEWRKATIQIIANRKQIGDHDREPGNSVPGSGATRAKPPHLQEDQPPREGKSGRQEQDWEGSLG